MTKLSRRATAKAIGAPDISGGIPLARWIRAQTFERLVRDDAFASQIASKTVGSAGLGRPKSVRVVDASEDITKTREFLKRAVREALESDAATLIATPACPFPGFEEDAATAVLPDFAVVTRLADYEATLIVGDAKDYERVRTRIDDQRMLKGFIQVAFGAEAFDSWADLPADLSVNRRGVLAVPRNAFLQPTVVSEDLADHRTEVQMRLAERLAEAETLAPGESLSDFVAHLEATFDPATCSTCPLFSYCRGELRRSETSVDFLIELGVPRSRRASLAEMVEGGGVAPNVPRALTARVRATIDGVAQSTGQRRNDPLGQPGTINVALVKSDGSALGVHGLAVQSDSSEAWESHVFLEPQSLATRRAVMEILGVAISANLAEPAEKGEPPRPVQLVVPDSNTADLLASIADSLAGVEISRLRWERDVEQGRTPLTFDGDPAMLPEALSAPARFAVSFLLEEDRARAFSTRTAIFDARSALSTLLIAGGPQVNAGRLDYLVGWAESTSSNPLDARAFADAIETSLETPGARLSNRLSDEINDAAMKIKQGKSSEDEYQSLVEEALTYRIDTLSRAIGVVQSFPTSSLRPAHVALEADAQVVWRRRLDLQANDLVRFARTTDFWRNKLVDVVQKDAECAAKLTMLENPDFASDKALDAGFRQAAFATVVSVAPLRLSVASRSVVAGKAIALVHVNGRACVEDDDVTVKVQKSSFAISGLSIGELTAPNDPTVVDGSLLWDPKKATNLAVGDVLIVVDAGDYFSNKFSFKNLNVDRPPLDDQNAPGADCSAAAFLADPERHKWCCRPHADREAETSDFLATKRLAGELNPEVWPPLQDLDAFDVSAHGEPIAESVTDVNLDVPESLTPDDLD